jgi:hypothetical protein
MLYATAFLGIHRQPSDKSMGGYIYSPNLKQFLNGCYEVMTKIQASGDELERCCAILGRQLPPNREYTFLGDNAREIAMNWY